MPTSSETLVFQALGGVCPHYVHPKGLMLYRVLFAVPRPGKRILGLTAPETEWIVRALTHLPKRLFKSTAKVRDAFETLFAAYDSERLAAIRSVKLKSATLELLIAIIEAARLLPTKTPNRIATIMKRMRDHPEKEYPIEALSLEAELSAAALSETFKRAAGLPPHAYLIDCRIRKAQTLLADGKLSIKAISDMLRFSSTQHFATTFKKITGSSPSEVKLRR